MKTQTVTILDGAMGTMLMRAGLGPGQRPELLSLTAPEAVEAVNAAYVYAGAQMILANTFGANAYRLSGTGHTPEEVIGASVRIALRAAAGSGARVALDIGPTGEIMEPLGEMSFETAYGRFAQMIRAGVQAGAQAIFFETFSDLNELRAGVLAARECCALPVYACMTFERTGYTFLGCRADAAAMALDCLGVAAVGVNCSLGPQEAAPILRAMRTATNLPLIFKPNAGKPNPEDGTYAQEPEAFAQACAPLLDIGAAYIGGCCGTTPDFTAALARRFGGRSASWEERTIRGVCSAGTVVPFGKGISVVGERINPTGNARVKRALMAQDMDDIARLAAEQEEAGAQILDINVGLPGLDEAQTMRRVVTAVSAATALPLQIDSANAEAIEAGLRAAPGKCIVNSVSATRASMEAVLPLARRYGAAVIALTLGEGGLPENAAERLVLASRILAAARSAGIAREDVIVDCLTLTVSAQQEQARETLEAVRRVSREWGLATTLGISNIAFGLPQRPLMAQVFLTQALACGLTLPILNPNRREMMDAVAACRALSGEDEGCASFIARYAPESEAQRQAAEHGELTLEESVMAGMKGEAARLARERLASESPLELVEKQLIPALNEVGRRYEDGRAYLPQLMRAAEAARAAFDEVRAAIRAGGAAHGPEKGPVLLATVEGDLHDLGKNIVHTVLESYGYSVLDLGRDVPAERVAEEAKRTGAKVIGLSALMTTTLPGMARTIRVLRASGVTAPIVVGGAVLTPEYAERIGADFYSGDAGSFARIVQAVLDGANTVTYP